MKCPCREGSKPIKSWLDSIGLDPWFLIKGELDLKIHTLISYDPTQRKGGTGVTPTYLRFLPGKKSLVKFWLAPPLRATPEFCCVKQYVNREVFLGNTTTIVSQSIEIQAERSFRGHAINRNTQWIQNNLRELRKSLQKGVGVVAVFQNCYHKDPFGLLFTNSEKISQLSFRELPMTSGISKTWQLMENI